ncbi:hypothetical protein RN001_002804 [Aquatica leii]|uniref:Ig-like domain-containing protein n=1 Tax=Aquatica leii TaxID=1421715 RepID=A0AAN7QNQ5_9COLE|nr:hypothetical protein RN001_002804 [Aquatica leii]
MPPVQVFQSNGVTVDLHNSTENQVVLSSVQLTTTGTYRCEVSGEAPSFQTVTEHGHMMVVALPEEGPRITGGKPRYQIGDTVRVNCTSGRSKPAALLNWFINGEQADPSFLRGPETIITGREGLETSILGLEFIVKQKHFRRGDMKLKCSATIATIYWRSNEESVEGERPPRASVLESRGTVAPAGSRADRVQAAGSHTTFLPRVSILTMCSFVGLILSLSRHITSAASSIRSASATKSRRSAIYRTLLSKSTIERSRPGPSVTASASTIFKIDKDNVNASLSLPFKVMKTNKMYQQQQRIRQIVYYRSTKQDFDCITNGTDTDYVLSKIYKDASEQKLLLFITKKDSAFI